MSDSTLSSCCQAFKKMSDSTTSKKIMLKSSDGAVFEVSETMGKQSKTICHMIEGASTEIFIPLMNDTYTAPILAKVIEYCWKHAGAADVSKPGMTKEGSSTTSASSRISAKELRIWDKQFVDVDQEMLFELIMAADNLNIEGQLNVACQKMADMIKEKNPEEIHQIFNIKYSFSPEEEEEIRRENYWTFNSPA